MVQTVVFWVMRHGQKGPGGTPDEDTLTPKGRAQVRASALANLQGVGFNLALHSGQVRARQTVEEALKALGQTTVPIQRELGFGFAWAEDGRFPIDKKTGSLPAIDAAKKAGEPETLELWLRHWPNAMGFRGAVMQTLRLRGLLLARDYSYKNEVAVLVGSHSPTGECAALKPSETPRLGLADIIVYTVNVNTMTEEATITASEVLKAPAEPPTPA